MLRDYLRKVVILYKADILIYLLTQERHLIHVHQVLHKLHENQVYVKGEKCEFHKSLREVYQYPNNMTKKGWLRTRKKSKQFGTALFHAQLKSYNTSKGLPIFINILSEA